MKKHFGYLFVSVLFAGLMIGCEGMGRNDDDDSRSSKSEKTAMASAQIRPSGAAATRPVANNVTGTVTFTEEKGGVRVVANIKGLKPNSMHGFHIHQKADLSAPDLSSAGDHFNPTGAKHGGPHKVEHHLGDLGNLEADDNGNAKMTMVMKGLSLQGKNGIVGKSVLVHAEPDDLQTDPSGKSGARIAGGVIEMKK